MLSSENHFAKQNIWLKLFITLIGSVTTVAVPIKGALFLTGVNVLYLSTYPAIFRRIGTGIGRFLPFFAGYALVSMLMGSEFIGILIFLLRMVNLILIMVYFAEGLDLQRMMQDFQGLKSSPVLSNVLLFFLAIAVFIKEFREYYKVTNSLALQDVSTPVKKGNKLVNLLPRFVEAIRINWLNRDKVEATATALFRAQYATPALLTGANMLGLFYITALVIVIAL